MRRLIEPVPEPVGPCAKCGSTSWIDLGSIEYAAALQASIDEHRRIRRRTFGTVVRRGLVTVAYVAWMLRELAAWELTWHRIGHGMPLSQINFHWFELALGAFVVVWLGRAVRRWWHAGTLPVALRGHREGSDDEIVSPIGGRACTGYRVVLYRGDDWAPRLIVTEGAATSGRCNVGHPSVDADDPRIAKWMQIHGLDAAQYTWRAVETTLG